jgi:hypothetical protein
MGKDVIVYRPPPSDQLHPLVYKVAIGLVLCFVVSAWVFFDRQADVGWLLAVASGLLLLAIVLPSILWRVWRKYDRPASSEGETPPFRDWAAGEFNASDSSLKGSLAATDALLPIAAVGFGLMALGIVFAATAH